MSSIFQNNLDDSIIVGLHKISHKIYNKQLELLSCHDITVQQFRILKFIILNKNKNTISQKDIENHMNIKGSSVSILIKTMLEKDLILKTQSLNDARFFELDVTEKGVRLANLANDIFRDFEIKIRKNVSDQEIENVKNILKHLEMNINIE